MTPTETVGLIASLIAIFEVGYLAGKWQTNRQRHATLDEAVATRIRQTLGALEIRRLTSDSQEASPGQTIRIFYDVFSKAAFPYQVWLGASIVDATGIEHFDQSEDKEITLEPGQTTHSRYLTVSGDALAGSYSLYGAIWLGARATPVNSIRLARLESPSTLQLITKAPVLR
ncbi:MAG TPA: hypothetical protein VNA69_19740 [Thermoanaerobaculia bacterium]|nr:hypothetical protein [Thermoanaerobaculia bacterium]